MLDLREGHPVTITLVGSAEGSPLWGMPRLTNFAEFNSTSLGEDAIHVFNVRGKILEVSNIEQKREPRQEIRFEDDRGTTSYIMTWCESAMELDQAYMGKLIILLAVEATVHSRMGRYNLWASGSMAEL